MEKYIMEMTIPLVIIGCLVSGYILNNYVKLNIKNIPLIMSFVGALINVFLNGLVSIETSIVYGALNGLISTGLYETFKNMIKEN